MAHSISCLLSFVFVFFGIISCSKTGNSGQNNEEEMSAIQNFNLDYDSINSQFCKQWHEDIVVRYGERDGFGYPNINIEPVKYVEVTEILKRVPRAEIRHCKWETFELECWYIEDGDSLELILATAKNMGNKFDLPQEDKLRERDTRNR